MGALDVVLSSLQVLLVLQGLLDLLALLALLDLLDLKGLPEQGTTEPTFRLLRPWVSQTYTLQLRLKVHS